LRQALRQGVAEDFTDYEARRAGYDELRPQERTTQVIAGDRHRLKVSRVKDVAAARLTGGAVGRRIPGPA
jgi:hypothetical protein